MLERSLTALVVVAGLGCLATATDGFRACTSEGARRLAVAAEPRDLSNLTLLDHHGHAFSWSDYLGRPVLVEFIFTTCPDVCQKMSSDLGRLADASRDTPTRFVSVTFDLENDTLDRLQRVASHYGAGGERWRFARVQDKSDLAQLLDEFGVVAIPSPTGFEHNTAIHGVNPHGQLARIADIESTDEMLQWAVATTH